MTVRLAISVLNHRAAELTERCVEHLEQARAATGARCETQLWLRDNGSELEDWESLQNALRGRPWIHLLRNEDNVGFSAGHNQNIERALTEFAPHFVWLLNNDCLVDAECINALLEGSAADPAVAIWGATLLESDHRTVQCAGGCYYSPWLTTYRQFAAGRDISDLASIRPRPFDYIAGASMWMSADVLEGQLAPPPGIRGQATAVMQPWRSGR